VNSFGDDLNLDASNPSSLPAGGPANETSKTIAGNVLAVILGAAASCPN
jgi:hypothetical protein